MPHSPIPRTAQEVFGWPSLRGGQEESISALLEDRDVLTVLPTGGGKSAIYQLAGILRDGITIVVSPLIALQADQLNQLSEHPNAPRAVAINSTLGERATEEAWESLESGATEFVFLAPEQLAKDDVLRRLATLRITLFVVDEAHCVASWGHDFRPDYLRLGEVRDALGNPTTVALTATGAEPVRVEIIERLALKDPLVVVHGVDRPNIDLDVRRSTSESEKRDAVLELVPSLPRPGLLYAATRREAEEYGTELSARGMRADVYHAGLSARERARVHEAFLDGASDVVVATNAFGMGIDKPDVRFVVHASVPESLDAYYQEIGRSGRDGEAASAVLFYRSEDLGLRKYFAARGTDAVRLRGAYTVLAAARGPLRGKDLAAQLGVSTRSVTALVNQLVEGGSVRLTRDGAETMGPLDADDAVVAAEEAAERRQRIEESRVEVMRRYAETRDCRRRVLLGYFGENLPEPCGHCDTCRAGTADEIVVDEFSVPFPAGAAVEHIEWGRGSVVDVEDDRLTVFFGEQGYKVLALDLVQEHGLLTLAG
ncbi:RecQ family ATP-dependent DNA helicase [Microbacterium sp. DT81.1]|uniref:RecQ family ATP-dependent DNA helicase n=1 Tax=Microbacterium sp. DT81.1 TaxID=3393413 RepID=UPI003CE76034